MAASKKKEPKLEKIRNILSVKTREIGKYVVYKWILPLVYRLFALWPIDEKLVVFADHRDRDMPDNFKSLYDMCQNNGYRCVFLSGQSFGSSVPQQFRKRLHMKYRFTFMKFYARCRVLFLVDYFDLADLVKKRPGTQVVQLWHGCGLLKKWGYAVTSPGWGASEKERRRYPIYVNQTLSTISSNSIIVKEGYREAFCCDPDIIQPLGCPRTDVYFDEARMRETRERIRSMFPQIGDRKIILYAPTFRGKSIPESYINHGLDFQSLKESLSEEFVIITKFHPLMVKPGILESERLSVRDFVFDVTATLEAEDVLPVADILITDYSSILFEYLLFERPIISYIYDIDEYIKKRDFFLRYDQLAPGPYVFTQGEIVEKLQTVDEWFDIERTRKYKEEFMSACDGHSTERIYKYVFEQEVDK